MVEPGWAKLRLAEKAGQMGAGWIGAGWDWTDETVAWARV